jgi:ketosteroid isomerase-like protein
MSGRCGENVASNADIVRSVTQAMERGDQLAVMGHVTRDVVWNVHAADPAAAPWFGAHEGKRGVARFLDELASVGFTQAEQRGLHADGDTVVTETHLAFDGPNGTHVEVDEVQVWRLVDGRISSVDVFLDTAAVAAAFA